MDFRLTEQMTQWRARARAFADDVVRPVAADLDAQPNPEQSWSWELVEEADARGLRQAPLPTEYGGASTDYVTNTIILEEIAAADLGTAVVLAQHWKFAQMVNELGTPSQRQRYLGRVAANKRGLFAASFTEPTAGSDNLLPLRTPGAGMQTFAEHLEGGHRITGIKRYISNANRADTIICFARTDRYGALTESVTAFLVPTDAPGLRIGTVHDKCGERIANNAEIFYEGVFVPDEDVLGQRGTALSSVGRLLRASNAYAAACALGIARECFDRTLAWCRDRVQGGCPIIEHQAVGSYLADPTSGEPPGKPPRRRPSIPRWPSRRSSSCPNAPGIRPDGPWSCGEAQV
jgi:alkylation response protein AidB-like acyl-CoA dehydrogenase